MNTFGRILSKDVGNFDVIVFLVGTDLQDDAVGVNGFVDEDAGQGGEVVGVLGGKILAGATAAAMALDFRVALQVVGQTVGDNGSLLDDVQPLWLVMVDFVDKQGVVGTSQNDRVDIGALVHELVNVFLDKIVCAVAAALAVFD